MIALHDTSFAYDPATKILEGITLTVRQGEFISLLGPSGCGKSSLLRLMAGLVDPSHGELAINGQPARRFRRANNGVSLVFQEPRLLPWRNVRRNIALPLELSKVPPTDQEALVE
ncbi:MAG: ATP-binding cassette domain-containing protein, partial [Planctomycetia bacterium]|nr:ATP-binding cassette domain-containing protein [Planctomycetia bacterium]